MIIINELEVASNLAHNRTFAESGDICNNEDEMWEEDKGGVKKYREEIQERFNYYYDYYLTVICRDSDDFEKYKKESIKWDVEDFKLRASEMGVPLTDEEAQGLLECMVEEHDAGIGVCWNTLDYYINNKDFYDKD